MTCRQMYLPTHTHSYNIHPPPKKNYTQTRFQKSWDTEQIVNIKGMQ